MEEYYGMEVYGTFLGKDLHDSEIFMDDYGAVYIMLHIDDGEGNKMSIQTCMRKLDEEWDEENDFPCADKAFLDFYRGKSLEEIYALLVENTDGLVIITSGEKDMIYGRKGQSPKRMKPFSVEVKSTLGAGDTFKAGCVYGLLKGFSDDQIVRFASACSAIAISRFPLPLNPPTMEEVQKLLNS